MKAAGFTTLLLVMAGLATLTTVFVSLLPGRMTTASHPEASPTAPAASMAGVGALPTWTLTFQGFAGSLWAQ